MKIFGIDPGKHGALAQIDRIEGEAIHLWDYREIASMSYSNLQDKVFGGLGTTADRAFIERPTPRRSNGVKNAFSSGCYYGTWLHIFAMFKIDYVEVMPRAWMDVVFGGARLDSQKEEESGEKVSEGREKYRRRKEKKKVSIEVAKRIYPSSIDMIGRSDDRAEALLIAHYGRMMLGDIPNVPAFLM